MESQVFNNSLFHDLKAIQSSVGNWHLVTNHCRPRVINVTKLRTELAQDRLRFQQRWFLTSTQLFCKTTHQAALPFCCSTLTSPFKIIIIIIIMLFSRLCYVALVREVILLALLYGKFLMIYLNRRNGSQSPTETIVWSSVVNKDNYFTLKTSFKR